MGAIVYLLSKLRSRRCGACGWRQLVPRAKRHADVVCERCLEQFRGKVKTKPKEDGIVKGLIFLGVSRVRGKLFPSQFAWYICTGVFFPGIVNLVYD
jgi:hypothetical protein